MLQSNFHRKYTLSTNFSKKRLETNTRTQKKYIFIYGNSWKENALTRSRKNLTWVRVRCKWIVDDCSQWTLTMSAPALIKSGTRCSGSTIICNTSASCQQASTSFIWNDSINEKAMQKKQYQMNIQRKVCHRAQGINHKRSNCNVWNKTTIHDINMNPITTSQFHCFYLREDESQILKAIKVDSNMQKRSVKNCLFL